MSQVGEDWTEQDSDDRVEYDAERRQDSSPDKG
jgi:hypothetical protein